MKHLLCSAAAIASSRLRRFDGRTNSLLVARQQARKTTMETEYDDCNNVGRIRNNSVCAVSGQQDVSP
jgi:hypothetical protein